MNFSLSRDFSSQESPERLADFFRSLSPDDRRQNFADMRVQLTTAGREVPAEKLILPEALKQKNLQNFDLVLPEKRILLGSVLVDGREVYLFRGFGGDKGTETTPGFVELNYYIDFKNEIEGLPEGTFEWYWDQGEAPLNQHRVINNPDLRKKGLGQVMLELSEDAAKHLGCKEMHVATEKRATASWFFAQGYEPEKPEDISPDYMAAILKKTSDYRDKFSKGVVLSKELN